MIKKYSDAKAEKAASARAILPAGGYVCNIISAKVQNTDWGDKLVLAVDVAEGEFKGFFQRDFDGNTNEDKKWRGTYRLNIPKDDGSENDGYAKRRFNNFIFALEDGNPGYTWDWDETKLKGKTIGLVWRNKEFEYNGRSGWTTEPGAVYDAASIREGKYKALADKPLQNKTAAAAPAFTPAAPVADYGDLPF